MACATSPGGRLWRVDPGAKDPAKSGTPAGESVGEEPNQDAVRVQAVAEVEAMSEADMDSLVAEQLNRLQSSAIMEEPVGSLPTT